MPRVRTGSALVALAVLALLPLLRTLRVQAMNHYVATQRYEDLYYVPPAPWLPVMSLGYDSALADLLWTRALVYFGDELVHRGDVEHVYDYADAMLALDPDFRSVYTWVGTAALYRSGEVTVDDMRRAIEYLERGVKRFPDDGELAWDLGATLAFELAPHLEGSERKAARARATEHFVVAARKGAGPPWLALQNFTQLKRLGRLEQAARHLEEMYGMVTDPAMKAKVASRLAQVRSRAAAEAFREANDQFEAARRADYPYMPATLYLLVGPRPPVDGKALLERRFLPDDRR